MSKAQNLEALPSGRFEAGDKVRLKRPAEHAHSFDDPKGELEVTRVLCFRKDSPVQYSLCEPGHASVTPFWDGDLKPAS